MKRILIAAMSLCASMVMASTNQVSVTVDFQVKKDSLEIAKTPGTIYAQMAGTKFYSIILTATTTNQNLSKGNIGSMGWCYMRNISSNSTVFLSTDNGVSTNFCLLPGEVNVFRFAPSCNITTIQYSVTNTVYTADWEFSPIEL